MNKDQQPHDLSIEYEQTPLWRHPIFLLGLLVSTIVMSIVMYINYISTQTQKIEPIKTNTAKNSSTQVANNRKTNQPQNQGVIKQLNSNDMAVMRVPTKAEKAQKEASLHAKNVDLIAKEVQEIEQALQQQQVEIAKSENELSVPRKSFTQTESTSSLSSFHTEENDELQPDSARDTTTFAPNTTRKPISTATRQPRYVNTPSSGSQRAFNRKPKTKQPTSVNGNFYNAQNDFYNEGDQPQQENTYIDNTANNYQSRGYQPDTNNQVNQRPTTSSQEPQYTDFQPDTITDKQKDLANLPTNYNTATQQEILNNTQGYNTSKPATPAARSFDNDISEAQISELANEIRVDYD